MKPRNTTFAALIKADPNLLRTRIVPGKKGKKRKNRPRRSNRDDAKDFDVE